MPNDRVLETWLIVVCLTLLIGFMAVCHAAQAAIRKLEASERHLIALEKQLDGLVR